MNKLFYLLFAGAGVIVFGTFLIYAIETPYEDSQIKTYLDAAWWTVATVTTVGYGDVVPVSEVGRIVAIVYMIIGITILAVFLSVLGAGFYQKRFAKEEKELSHGHKLILRRIDELEKNQKQLQSDLKKLIDKMKNS